jgi:hypothetical protein
MPRFIVTRIVREDQSYAIESDSLSAAIKAAFERNAGRYEWKAGLEYEVDFKQVEIEVIELDEAGKGGETLATR